MNTQKKNSHKKQINTKKKKKKNRETNYQNNHTQKLKNHDLGQNVPTVSGLKAPRLHFLLVSITQNDQMDTLLL